MTKKIGVSLSDDLYAWMQTQVEQGRADSISGLISELVAAKRQRTELAAFVADLIDEFGEPGAEAEAWVEAAIVRARSARQGHLPSQEGR